MDDDEELLAALAASEAEYDADQAEIDAAMIASLAEEERTGPRQPELLPPPALDIEYDEDAEFDAAIHASLLRQPSDSELIAALAASQAEYDASPFRITIQFDARLIGQIVGQRFVNSNAIARRVGHGCRISALRNPAEQSGIRIAAHTLEALEEAENEIMAKFYEVTASHGDPPGFQRSDEQVLEGLRGPLGPEEFRHVFVDNSNIWIAALSSFDDTGRCNQAVRLNVRGLTTLLERGRDGRNAVEVGKRFVAGSKPPAVNTIWQRYRDLGYHTEVHSRDQDTRKETSIDPILHGAALQLVTDVANAPPGAHTLVIATGDGNPGNGVTNFPKLVRSAATLGMRVEVWGWRNSFGRREFQRIANLFEDGRVTIHLLDEYKVEICYLMATAEERERVTAEGRRRRTNGLNGSAPPPLPPPGNLPQVTTATTGAAVAGGGAGPIAEPAPSVQEDDICIICMSSPREHVLIPCGHFLMCAACCSVPNMFQNGCPLCRKAVGSHVMLYR